MNILSFIDQYGVIHQYDVNSCKELSENYSLAIDPRNYSEGFFQKSFESYIYHPSSKLLVNPWTFHKISSCNHPSYINNHIDCNEQYFLSTKRFQIIKKSSNQYETKFNNNIDIVENYYFVNKELFLNCKENNYLIIFHPFDVITISQKKNELDFILHDKENIYFFEKSTSKLIRINFKNGRLEGKEEKLSIQPENASSFFTKRYKKIIKDSLILAYDEHQIYLLHYRIRKNDIILSTICNFELEENFFNRLFYFFDSKGKNIFEKINLSLLYDLADSTLFLLRSGYDQFLLNPFILLEYDTMYLKNALLNVYFWKDILYFRYDPYTVMKSNYLDNIMIRFKEINLLIDKIKNSIDHCSYAEIKLILSFYLKDTIQASQSIQKLESLHCLNIYHLIWYSLTMNKEKFFLLYKKMKDSISVLHFIFSLFCPDAYFSYKAIQNYLEMEKDAVFRAYALYWKAFTLTKLRDLIGAKLAVEKALAISENVPQFWELAADIAYLEEDYQKAISLYTYLIDHFGENSIWYQKRGVAWVNYGQSQKGCVDLWYAKEQGNEIAKTLFNNLCKK